MADSKQLTRDILLGVCVAIASPEIGLAAIFACEALAELQEDINDHRMDPIDLDQDDGDEGG